MRVYVYMCVKRERERKRHQIWTLAAAGAPDPLLATCGVNAVLLTLLRQIGMYEGLFDVFLRLRGSCDQHSTNMGY